MHAEHLYIKAYSDAETVKPLVCFVAIDDQFVDRIKTLQGMAVEFKLESLLEAFPVQWHGGSWAKDHFVTTHHLIVTATHCWWGAEVLTSVTSVNVFTERFFIDKLLKEIEAAKSKELFYSEEDTIGVKLRSLLLKDVSTYEVTE